jgi:hypothetical protein
MASVESLSSKALSDDLSTECCGFFAKKNPQKQMFKRFALRAP